MRRPAIYRTTNPRKDIHGWVIGFVPACEHTNTEVIFETCSGELQTLPIGLVKMNLFSCSGHVTREHATKVLSRLRKQKVDDVPEDTIIDVAVDELFDEQLFDNPFVEE